MSALPHHFYRHTSFIDFRILHVKVMNRSPFCMYQSFVKSFVFFFIHGAIQIRAVFPVIVPAGRKTAVIIQTFSRYNGSCRIEKAELSATQSKNFISQWPFCEWSSCHNDKAILRQGRNFFCAHRNISVLPNAFGYLCRK